MKGVGVLSWFSAHVHTPIKPKPKPNESLAALAYYSANARPSAVSFSASSEEPSSRSGLGDTGDHAFKMVHPNNEISMFALNASVLENEIQGPTQVQIWSVGLKPSRNEMVPPNMLPSMQNEP